MLQFKPTTSQYDYKNRIEEYRVRASTLTQVLAAVFRCATAL